MPAAAVAGLAQRVADLNPGVWTERVGGICGGAIGRPLAFPELAFVDRGSGCEVFAVDLSTGTVAPAADLGMPRASVGEYFGRTGEVRYFWGSGASGNGYWRTDGTPAGTWLLAEVEPGAPSWAYELFLVAGSPWSLFTLYRSDTGLELWRTDGTLAGTGPVVDLWPGPGSGVLGTRAVVRDGLLYFVGRTPVSGIQVWRTDGTAAGTVSLSSFPPDLEDSGGILFAALAGSVLFTGPGTGYGHSLWVTDGTPSGTAQIANFPDGIEPWPGLVAAGSRALFLSRGWDRWILWRSDGTPAGTVEVTWFSNASWVPDVIYPLSDESWFFFSGNDAMGFEPWISDGTNAGTHLWSEIGPGPGGIVRVSDFFTPLRIAGGVVLVLDDGVHGTEPWLFPLDGSSPRLISDLTPGTEYSFIWNLGVDGEAALLSVEGDLWTTDGTAGGTNRVAELARILSPSRPGTFTDAGDLLYFVALLPIENDGGHPGRTDGTEPGSRLLTGDYGVGNIVEGVSVLDNGTVIGATDLGESSLIWSSHGDEAVPLVDVAVQCDVHHTCPIDYVPPAAGSVSLFAYGSPTEGTELWSLDGTPQGTQLLLDLLPGTPSSRPSQFLDVGGEAWFTALDGTGEESLWRSEGTPATTSPLLVLGGDPEARVAAIWPIDVETGRFYFLRPGEIGLDLWYVDSGASTPEMVRAGLGYWPVTFLGIVGERILFAAREAKDPGFGDELWVSDGTAIGTRLLRDIHPGPGGSSIYWGAALPERLVFSACEPVAGCEVWRSDGSTAGTVRLLDVVPGAGSSQPRGFTRIGDFVYFSAERLATGREIWATDGTAEGTFQLPEIAFGPWPSVATSWNESRDFAFWNDRVYFAGDDGTGSELWAMPVLVFYDGFQTGDTSRWSLAP